LSRREDYAAQVSHVVLRYTVLRMAIFAAVLVLLFLAGARGILLAALTVAVSMALSYLLLARQRDAVAAVVAERVARSHRPQRPGADEAAEDAEDDARRARLAELEGRGPAQDQVQDGAQDRAQDDRAPNASPRPSSTP
jgi:hypothetical protein